MILLRNSTSGVGVGVTVAVGEAVGGVVAVAVAVGMGVCEGMGEAVADPGSLPRREHEASRMVSRDKRKSRELRIAMVKLINRYTLFLAYRVA